MRWKVLRVTTRPLLQVCAEAMKERLRWRTSSGTASSGKQAGAPIDTGETYDLVVVGGGISGLDAAHFFRKEAGARSRILILDNHGDFGGHAKRNEFHQAGKMLLGCGGTFSIESPAPYSSVTQELLRELGIDVEALQPVMNRELYRSLGLHSAVFFDKETFGADRLVIEPRNSPSQADPWKDFLETALLTEPLSATSSGSTTPRRTTFPGYPRLRRRPGWRASVTRDFSPRSPAWTRKSWLRQCA
jgi:spermidine dehydrogenase